MTFTGDHTGSDLQHWLYVGNTQGGANLFEQEWGPASAVTVFGLPTSGTISVRYWTHSAAAGISPTSPTR